MTEPLSPTPAEPQSAIVPAGEPDLAQATPEATPVPGSGQSEPPARLGGVTVKSEYSVKVRTVNADGTESVTTFDPAASRRVFRLIGVAALAIPAACIAVLYLIFWR